LHRKSLVPVPPYLGNLMFLKIVGFVLALLSLNSWAEKPAWMPEHPWAANFLLMGLTFHPDGGENEGYPRQLDDEAYFVIMPGMQADLDYQFHRYALARFSTSLYRDCADVWSGFFHLGPRVNLPIGERFVFRVGIGPTYLWRQNWFGVVAGYRKDSFYGDGKPGDFQTKFLWYGGDLDFEWKLNPKVSLIYANIPGWPEVITSNVGLRYTF
jgi:hypothetical protein